MGKENVTPKGIGSCKYPGHASQPSRTTSVIHFPIHVKRFSGLFLFNFSPIGHDFSKSRRTRDLSPFRALSSLNSEKPAEPPNSINPTRRFVPPLLAVRSSYSCRKQWSEIRSQPITNMKLSGT
jgi:hypothetical protein